MISRNEIALIHVAKSQLGLTDDEYRDLLRSTCNVESSKELTHRDCNRLMLRFKDLGFKLKVKGPDQVQQTKKHAEETNPSALPTPAHFGKIHGLYKELGWEKERQIGFNKRVIKQPWPQNRAEANKIIEALKSMVARGYSKEVQ
jgi:hypothetical protein